MIDSGCSRHMTGNMTYLTDYKEIDEGYVAFGRNHKEGKMIRKEVKTVSTSMETRKPLLKDEDGKEVDLYMYRSMIGSLMYLTCSRPDIMFAVCACAKYQVNPKDSHLYAMKRIFSAFLYGKIEEEVCVCQPPGFEDPNILDRVYKVEKHYMDYIRLLELGKAKKSVRLMMEKLFRMEFELMRVLKKSTKIRPWYPKDSPFDLVAYSDSDYVGESLDRKSITGGSAMPTDPHHTPTILQLSSQPQKKQKPRKPKRKDTCVAQPSDPTENVADEAIHKELGDILLEKKNRSRTYRLKILYKVGLTARVESSGDEESLGEDASKQGRIDAINAYEEIILVNVQDDADKEMFDVNVLDIEVINTAKLIVDVAQVSVASAATKTTNIDDVTLAQALEEIKSTKSKVKGLAIQELGKSTTTIPNNSHRAKLKEQKRKETNHQQKLNREYLPKEHGRYKIKDLNLIEFNNIKEMFNKAFKRVNTFEDFRTELVEGKEKRTGTELIQEITKKQKVEDDKETTKLKQFMEIIPDKEEVAIDTIPLVVMSLKIVDWKIYKE
nr:hypothetical protein [Tanacetum cinerariifolium]